MALGALFVHVGLYEGVPVPLMFSNVVAQAGYYGTIVSLRLAIHLRMISRRWDRLDAQAG